MHAFHAKLHTSPIYTTNTFANHHQAPDVTRLKNEAKQKAGQKKERPSNKRGIRGPGYPKVSREKGLGTPENSPAASGRPRKSSGRLGAPRMRLVGYYSFDWFATFSCTSGMHPKGVPLTLFLYFLQKKKSTLVEQF